MNRSVVAGCCVQDQAMTASKSTIAACAIRILKSTRESFSGVHREKRCGLRRQREYRARSPPLFRRRLRPPRSKRIDRPVSPQPYLNSSPDRFETQPDIRTLNLVPRFSFLFTPPLAASLALILTAFHYSTGVRVRRRLPASRNTKSAEEFSETTPLPKCN